MESSGPQWEGLDNLIAERHRLDMIAWHCDPLPSGIRIGVRYPMISRRELWEYRKKPINHFWDVEKSDLVAAPDEEKNHFSVR